ncbi:MAG: HNH endonuclease [Planctomycetes bacterium]|nr:HNH endonuclease [Planctomycetota bacterium]
MGTRRRIDAEHPAYHAGACDDDGRPQCRRCLGVLKRPHTMFCSAECEHEFRIRSSPAYARQAVFRRDRGVCSHCRLDCGLLDRIIARLRYGARGVPADAVDEWTGHRVEQPVDEEGEQTALWLIDQLGLGRRKQPCSLWQADHRIAFSDGGADCGLGNLRTLCIACHRLQTRELHRRVKARRQD